ncbi:HEPN domain-containing protein [Rhodoblastus sp. 17X3]|uniref:HEPN domain-containing protein n=1 Tax=Rhodoblastus sp. 17X3 TaxID=3047026 RepID=UPI0024B6B1FB|nr:HEPN domain-containing protein [Rhodoblastus sp. 17X3]MDI9849524.1 HEPN domain-containing protein [Rhodoblastus sp. 17X3]
MTQATTTNAPVLDAASLKTKQRALREGFKPALALRVHRAISWLGRAEAAEDDHDLRFILLWVGFNAAYARDIGLETAGERERFAAFFNRLVKFDKTNRIYNGIWKRFPHEIRLLLDNRYVFAPFWAHHNGYVGFDDWEARLSRSKQAIGAAMARQDTPTILSILFDRLYVLRNQLVHGGATWSSSVNRHQVNDGSAVLSWLLPIFIDLLMDNPDYEWGKPFYPVVE